jgi:hypothetical protein
MKAVWMSRGPFAKESTMDNYTLKNGYTFLALSGGNYGGWAKATNPITAIKDAVKEYGANTLRNKGGIAVMVMYGPSETLKCGPLGGFTYEATPKERPTPIGLFFCKGRTIKPMKKGDMNPDHPDHEEWMVQTSNDIEEDVAYWIEKNENAA